MNSFLATVIAAAMLCGSAANAQAQQNIITANLIAGEKVEYDHRRSPRDTSYEVAFRCNVPAMSIGAVTLAHIGGASGSKHDIEVAERVTFGPGGHMVASEISGSDYSDSRFPKVVVLGMRFEDHQHVILIHARDEIPADYRVYCDAVSVPEQFGWALLKTMLSAAMREYVQPQTGISDNVSLALDVALTLAKNDNVLAIGMDVFRHEVRSQLNQKYPDNPDLVNFLTAFSFNMIEGVYKRAFYEVSGFR